jgi:AraC-like DNA-binding protein
MLPAYAHNPLTLHHIASYLRKRGVDPVEIFRCAGVSPSMLLGPNNWLPRDLCFALSEHAATVAGEPFFGARIGQLFRLTELGAWGHAIVAAANVGQACAVAARSVGLVHQGTDLRFITFRRDAQLRIRYRGKLAADPQQHLIGTLALLRKIALLAGTSDAIGVRFSMPYARGLDALEETHGPALEFGCAHDAIVIDREILGQLLRCNDGANPPNPAEAAAAITALVKQLLPYGHITIEAIAAQQRLSVRTLQRRLRDWGFSFEELVDDVRQTEAIRYVLAGKYSAMEIAFLLGYSDHPHFTRAFKRWTGLSPQAYFKLAPNSKALVETMRGNADSTIPRRSTRFRR